MQTKAAPAVARFPSPQFEQRIAELRAAIANDRSELEIAQKKLAAMFNNRDALTAVGKDAETEIRNAKAGVQALERRIAVARDAIVQAFRSEYKSFEQLRADTWRRLYEEFVVPTSDEILAAAQILNAKLREVVALAKSQPAEFAGLLDYLKSQADKWNELVRDFGGLGIGSNLAASKSESDLRANVAHALTKVIREHFGPTSPLAEALALFTVESWRQAPPTMAERVEARRQEFSRRGEPFNP